MIPNINPRPFRGSFPKPSTPKKSPKPLKKMSEKRKEEIKSGNGQNQDLDNWFEARRNELTGFCHCGCGLKSQKNDDYYFRFSVCHIYGKARFESVATHPQNFVEMAFFGGCHGNMDNRSMENWPGMECWDEIKHKVKLMQPHLTEQDKASKFHNLLMELIDNN